MPNKEVYIKNYKVEKEYTNSLTFDGVNDYVSIPHNAKFNLTGSLTIEGWVYINNSSSFHMVATKTTGNGGAINTFELRVDITTRFLTFIGVDTAFKSITSTVAVPLNLWSHIAVTKTAGTVNLYINGQNVGSGSIGTTNTNTNPVYLGARNDLTAPQLLTGQLSEVRIWNTARTQQQISENKNKKLTGTESGLVGYYPLNEGTGTTATDLASSPVNGTLTNFPASPWSTSLIAPVHKRTYKGITEYQFRSITSNLNNGYGDVGFSLPKKFDDFGAGVTTGLDGYEADIIVYDQGQLTGQTVFSGEIVTIDREQSDGESVGILGLGPIFRLEKTFLLSAAGSHQVTYTTLDLAEMIRQVLASYNSQQFLSQITYTALSLPNTGIVRTVSFNNATCLDAIQTIFKMSATNSVWYLGVDKVFYLATIASSPKHYFFIGKDIIKNSIKESKLEIINDLAFWDGGSVAREYKNQASIDTYGLFSERKRDDRYTVTASMDSYGQRVVATQNTPNLQVEITVLDSSAGGYDLELIKVGDTCKILNVANTSGLSNNMVITKKVDYLDYAVLTIADVSSYTSRELYNLKKDQQLVSYDSGPATYTIV
jgi:hypothetical protein